ncbi:alpha-ketoacid dehydrogenase subunit alpha/beta [Rosettibacter firmus]|uniref:alpha-ketoacid dehydrogenase subunit alpha/beta n=1 Tax=Rosettibacter firmus TaxID=3111522 RepID=UPI00336C12E6
MNKYHNQYLLNHSQALKSIDGSFSKEELLEVFKLMLLSREIDNKQMTLIKQGKAFFHIAGAGHEAVQIAFGKLMNKGVDWAYPYYRDLAFVLAIGITPKEIFLNFLAKANDEMSGGRQMPSHWASKKLNIPSQSSPTGTQYLQAVGTALGLKKQNKDGVVLVSSGEGATSEGEFHEAVNWACRDKLPVIFLIENNKWAISVPVENQTSGKDGSISEMMKGYENLYRIKIDGTNFFQSYSAALKSFDYARNKMGPVLVEADVVRIFSHSSSDDQKKYIPKEILDEAFERDPIKIFSKYLIKEGLVSEEFVENMKESIHQEINQAADEALKYPEPEPETAIKYVYDESNRKNELDYEKSFKTGKSIVMVDAINHALKEEMEINEKIFVFGEDVADPKGGVFTATKGLSTRFGNNRVFNSPLAEASIVGVAIGMSLTGIKPCVEIQFGDYIWPAFMQIRNELVMYRYRSNNLFETPVVIRVPVGGYIHGGIYHSQNIESFFTHMPGLLIAYPSNAADAKGLLKTALRLNDPVLFLEHKGLYRQSYASSPEPDSNYLLPFGKAKIIKEGNDLTVVTYGAMVHETNFAAKKLEEDGYSIEIIDLRTLQPLDVETIYQSVKKTGKVAIVHEDTLTAGFGAEIAALISDSCFEYLDGPIKRIAAKDSPIPYSNYLEKFILPDKFKIYNGLLELLNY